jgi:hypothetical protein
MNKRIWGKRKWENKGRERFLKNINDKIKVK